MRTFILCFSLQFKKHIRALLFFLILPFAINAQPFVTTWKTDNPGTSGTNEITIPTTGVGYTYNVDWGDTNSDSGVAGNITHTYATAGTYTVSITGAFPRIFFNNAGDRQKILTVEQWGAVAWTSMASAFRGCVNLSIPAVDTPDLSGVSDMTYMFRGATSFNDDISSWDVSSITNMTGLFRNADAFNQPLSTWDITNVTNMSEMFEFALNFNQDIRFVAGGANTGGDAWNTTNVADMSAMFAGSFAFNQPIGNWNVNNVTKMNIMFSVATVFDQDIGNWNVSNVTNIIGMFNGASAFNQDISTKVGLGNYGGDAWNVSNITDMSSLLQGTTVFNQDISNWDVSNVMDMGSLFSGATAFNQNIGGWVVSSATQIPGMFAFATSFNQDISGWNVSMVNDMNGMFDGATSFNQDIGRIGGWDVSGVSDMRQMFQNASSFDQDLGGWDFSGLSGLNGLNFLRNSGLSVANYDNLLIGLQAQIGGLNTPVTFEAQNIYYCAGESARSALIAFGWSLDDGGSKCITLFDGPDTTGPEILNGQAQAIDFGSTPATVPKLRSFTLENPTAISLTNVVVTISGTAFTTPVSSSVILPGTTATFDITLNSAAVLPAFTETVTITSDDFTGSFQFPIAGEVTVGPAPEIAIFEGIDVLGNPILTGITTYYLGEADRGMDVTNQFTITNIGSADLDISGLSITGTDFSLGTSAPFTIPVDNSVTIDVTLTGAAAGGFGETITILSNDTNEGTFNFDVSGQIIGPDIWVVDGLNIFGDPEILNGQLTPIDFGSATLGSNIVRQMTITDDTYIDLTVSSISISGTAFTINSPTPPIIIIGTVDGVYDERLFEISLSGATAGTFTETVTILNDDDFDPVFTFPITGTILSTPPAVVSTTPTLNAVNVPANANLLLNFDQNMNGATVNGSNIIVTGEQSGKILGLYTGGGTPNITFDPFTDFKPGELIRVTLTTGLQNTTGGALSSTYSAQFLVANSSGPETPNYFFENPATVLSTTIDAFQVHAADIDSDGDLDIAAIGSADNKVVWFQNNGAASFTEIDVPTTGLQPKDLFVTDFDLDGDIDIVVGFNNSDAIFWFDNNGSEVFTERIVSSTAPSVEAVFPIDLDADGDMDVVAANESSNEIVWYENDGAMGFGSQLITSSMNSPRGAYAADIDSDGDLDVVASSLFADQVIWFENDGTQTFTPNTITGVPAGPWTVFAIDFDLDGDMDLISGSELSDEVAWYENDGSQNFVIRTITSTADGVRWFSVNDIDADGDLDIATASDNDNKIAWYENIGFVFTEHVITTNALQARGIFLADLDADGDLDAISGSEGDDKVAWYENTLSPCLAPPTANAGIDLTICEGSTVSLSGSITNASIPSWSTPGDGTFDNAAILTPVYTPGTTDISASSVILTLTTEDPDGAGSCTAATALITISIDGAASVSAGADVTICATDVVSLAGTMNPNASNPMWSPSGTGSFSTPNNLNATYTPSLADITTGSITLTLTVDGVGVCPQVSDQVVVTIALPITAGSPSIQSNVGVAANVDVIAASTINVGDVIVVTILTSATKGTAVVLGNNTIDYTASTGTVGADSFDYQICNQCSLCSTGTVSIDILNEPPVLTPPSTPITSVAGQSVTVPFLTSITDVNDNIDTNSIQIIAGPTSSATATFDASFNLTIDYSNTPFAGTDQITIEVCDLLGACSQITLSIDVDGEITPFNGISPNGDGLNDYFKINNIQFLEPQNKVTIYNRWGDNVFDVSDYHNDIPERRFEGISKSGKDLSSGVYFYKIEFSSGREGLNGYVTLKR